MTKVPVANALKNNIYPTFVLNSKNIEHANLRG